jgi:hypothetical protein
VRARVAVGDAQAVEDRLELLLELVAAVIRGHHEGQGHQRDSIISFRALAGLD